MSDNELKERLKEIKIEDMIWCVYIVIIFFSFYSNYLEREYLIFKNRVSKDNYKKINISIFIVLVVIYVYYAMLAYKDIKELNKGDDKNKIKYTYMSFIASILALISGIIFLYIAINDKDIDTEIAFD